MNLNELSLFSGAGGGGYFGSKLLGWRHVGYVEYEKYCQEIINQRIKDGFLDEAPIFGDIDEFIKSGASKSTRDMSMWLRQVFPANHLALQESKKDKTMKETSGRKRFNVFATFNPDTHSWRTSQVSLILDTSAKSSLRWPKQGIMQDGLCWEQTMWEPGIEEKDSGSRLNRQSIPTPSAWDGMRGPAKQYDPKSKSQKDRNLNTFGRIYPKPGMWPTPTVQDSNKATKRWRENHQNNLTAAVFNPEKIFPTPTTRDWKGGYRTESLIRKDGKVESNGCLTKRSIKRSRNRDSEWWATEPDVGRVAHGVARRVDRLKAVGNGQVPSVVKQAWEILSYET